MVRLVQTVDLCCTDTNTISKRIKTRFYMTHVTKEFHLVHPKRFLKLWYVWCKLWTYVAPILTLSQMNHNEILHDPRHLGVTSGASKIISELTVRSAQTVHLSWIKISTISERTETSFHLSLVTQEYHPVHPKQFLSPWYVWRKPCTYHSPKLTLSPKGPKGDSTWPASHRSSIGCVQNDLWGYGTFGANCGSILHRD
jgi:hypothetical protein